MNAPRKILSGLFYTVGSTYFGRIFSLLAGLWILPRMIDDPKIWGGVFLGASLYLVMISLKEMGLAHALLHHHDRLEELAPTHFILNLFVSGSCIAAILALALFLDSGIASYLIRYFNPQSQIEDHSILVWTLVCLAAFNLLRSASITSETRLRGRLEFKSLAFIHMLAIILSLGAAVVLAWHGYGMWALIIGGTSSHVAHAPVYTSWYQL